MSFNFGVNIPIDDDFNQQISSFLQNNKSKSTVYNTNSAVTRLNKFLKEETKRKYSSNSFDQLQDAELDELLCEFFMNAKKNSNKKKISETELYQPDTLSNLRNGWQRHLNDIGRNTDLKQGSMYQKCQKVLKARRKQLTRMGLGNKPNATRAIDQEEVDKLYETGIFGFSNPLSLQRTIWWKITNHFGFRPRDESRRLKFGDVKLVESGERSYLEWDTERGTKTRKGETAASHQRAFNPGAYATGGERCVVNLYKIFIEHRPEESKQKSSPFFLSMIPKERIKSNVWYYNTPLGVNSIGKFMIEAREVLDTDTGCSRSKLANHSARKMSISSMLNNHVNPLHVIQLTGHKNIESLKPYHNASKHQQQQMSDFISGKSDNRVLASSPQPSNWAISCQYVQRSLFQQNQEQPNSFFN